MQKLREARKNKKVKTLRRKGCFVKVGTKISTGKSHKITMIDGDPFYLSYRLGKTINNGNYENTKIEFGLTMPTTKEKLTESKKWLVQYVDRQLESLLPSDRSSVLQEGEG